MKSTKKGFIVLIVIIAITVLFGLISLKSEPAPVVAEHKENSPFTFVFGNDIGKMNAKRNFKKNYVAVIYITGTIQKEGYTYNQKWIMDTIDFLEDDRFNKGIMLFIDSPGGTVYESDETYLRLMDYKSCTERPVYAYFGSLAASGGYYIASAADHIIANRNTLTGSIGVIAGQSIDATELFQKIGIKSRTFHAGRNKTMMNYDEPLTEEQAAIMQSVADDAYEQFTSIVAKGRDMPIAKVKELADGRIYTANQALKNGLIDGIDSFENAKYNMIDDNGLTCDFEEFKFEYRETFRDLFRNVTSFVKNPVASSPMTLNYIAY